MTQGIARLDLHLLIWSRLNVIRSSLTEITNASKPPNPAMTSERIYALLKKQAKESRNAAKEFETEQRLDLSEQELQRVIVFEAYLSGIDCFRDEDISKAAEDAIEALQSEGRNVNMGLVIKAVKSNLKGKSLDMGKVAEFVRGMTFKRAPENGCTHCGTKSNVCCKSS